MKKFSPITLFLSASLLSSMLTPAASATSVVECLSNGFETGTFAAQQFCQSLESAYQTGTMTQSSFNIQSQLCNAAVLIACRAAVRITVATRPLCRQLVASNWDGAADKLREYDPIACPR